MRCPLDKFRVNSYEVLYEEGMSIRNRSKAKLSPLQCGRSKEKDIPIHTTNHIFRYVQFVIVIFKSVLCMTISDAWHTHLEVVRSTSDHIDLERHSSQNNTRWYSHDIDPALKKITNLNDLSST